MNFSALAGEFGIKGIRPTEADEILSVFKQACTEQGTLLIEIPIPCTENVYPMVVPGKANREMMDGVRERRRVVVNLV